MTTKKAYFSIAIVAVISTLSALLLPGLQFNFDFDDFFEMGDPNWMAYQQHVEEFGHDNDYLLIAIENSNGIFNPSILNKVDSLIKQIRKIDGVTKIISPLSAQKFIQAPIGTILVPYLHKNDAKRLKKDSIQLRSHPNLAERLVATQVNALAFIVYHDRFNDKLLEGHLSESITHTVSGHGFEDFHIAGRIKAQSIFVQLIKENFSTFLLLSAVLIVIILSLLFRQLKWVIVPLIVIGLSLIVSLSVLVLTDQAIDVLSSMLPTILLITSMSDITHFLTRYLDLCAKGFEKKEAIKLTFKEVGMATFLTSLTTSIGFLTLVITDSMPVKNLGIYTAIGVMITYAITFTVLPATAVLTKPPPLRHRSQWDNMLSQLFLITIRNSKKILVVYTLLIVLAGISVTQLVVDTPLIADFPKDHQVTKDFQFFDRNFGGSKPLEVHIQINNPEVDMLSPIVLNEVEKVTTYLRSEFSSIASPTDLIKTLNMSNNGGQVTHYKLPEDDAAEKVFRLYPQMAHHFPVRLIADDKKRGRITGFSKDLGSKAGIKFKNNFERFLADEINTGLLSFQLTGTSYLFDLTTETLVENIISGLIIAISVVALIMSFLFRSIKMILITVLPNVLPLVFLAALMALTGIPLRLSTSIIFAIAFGIAVDDTIHFLTRYRLESNRPIDHLKVLKRTFVSTGKAMTLTTLILSLGFAIFTFSSFDATFYTGLLISITLITALIVDLTLLPILLLLLIKNKNVRPI